MVNLSTGGGYHTTASKPRSIIVAQVYGSGFRRSRDPQSYWLAVHLGKPMGCPEDSGPVVETCWRSGTERLRKEYLADPSQCWDDRQSKKSRRSPHFKHKTTKESPWDGWYNSTDMLEKRLKASTGQAQDRRLVELNVEEALASMEERPQPPSVQNLTRILHKIRTKKNLVYTKRLYTYLSKNGLEDHRSLGNYVIPMLVQVGSMWDAEQVFNKLVDRNEHSWNSLIWGYIEFGDTKHALNLYQKMQEDFVHPSKYTFVSVLKACARLKDAERGQQIHTDIARKGLERNLFVGNVLVDMYGKCGSLVEAWEVFDKLQVRDKISWNAMITGYAQHGLGKEALNCLEQMQLEGLFPDAVTFVCGLKACGSIGAIDKGREIHAEIARKGLERVLVVGNTLVDVYAKCSSLVEAQEVFDKLPVRDKVSWNALITGNAEQGLGEVALYCLEQMQLEGLYPDAVTFVCSLKACSSIGERDKGRELRAEMARKGLETDLLGNTLVDMYAKCGSLTEAWEVFDKLPNRDEVSWNALIAGYTEYGHGEEALSCLGQMQLEGLCPNAITFVCCLKACGCIGAIDKGQGLHTDIARKGLESDLAVGSTLVDMYAKCGSIVEAWEALEKLPVRDGISWNALIAGYVHHGLGEEALNCLEQMHHEGLRPNDVTFVSGLKACGSIGVIVKGREMHSEIARKGLERDLAVGSTLVDMYAKCGSLVEAQEAFDMLPVQDEVLWNALIAGYAQHGLTEDVLKCLEQMQLEGLFPNSVAFVCSLKACGSIGAIDKGRELYTEIARKGLEIDLLVGNTLVDMYAKCGSLAEAQEAFDLLPVQDEVSWYALIAGYVHYGLGEEVLNCLKEMQVEGFSPYAVIFVCSLKACGSMRALDEGREIHAEIARKGLEGDLVVGTTLVDMYAKCYAIAEAWQAFDKLPVRDEVSWNAMIAGHVQHGFGEEALNLLELMQLEGLSPNTVTFVCSLKACGTIGAIDKGREMHAETARKGLESHLAVGNTLVDIYAKGGLLADAWEAFDKLSVRDEVSWNALIAGYAQHGESEMVFHILDRMRGEEIKPNEVTFSIVLALCSHVGLVDKGQDYFEAMSRDYGIIPTIEHHNGMIDLFGRAGQLNEVVVMVKKMPFHPDLWVWQTVLGACQKWGNVELGILAFKHVVQLNEKDAASYVLMSNIVADAHMQEEEKKIEAMRLINTSMEEARTEFVDK